MALHEYQKRMYEKVGTIAALIILPVAGFFAGMAYQKQTSPAAPDNTVSKPFGQRLNMRGNRVIGAVKSISDTSITVTERFNKTDKTYTIGSNTTYKNGTSDTEASDIKTGDTVMLTLNEDDTSKVTVITVNPAMMFRGDNTKTTQE